MRTRSQYPIGNMRAYVFADGWADASGRGTTHHVQITDVGTDEDAEGPRTAGEGRAERAQSSGHAKHYPRLLGGREGPGHPPARHWSVATDTSSRVEFASRRRQARLGDWKAGSTRARRSGLGAGPRRHAEGRGADRAVEGSERRRLRDRRKTPGARRGRWRGIRRGAAARRAGISMRGMSGKCSASEIHNRRHRSPRDHHPTRSRRTRVSAAPTGSTSGERGARIWSTTNSGRAPAQEQVGGRVPPPAMLIDRDTTRSSA